MTELIIGGIALAPVIVALVELAKKLGLPSEYAPLANGALSVVALVVIVLLADNPEWQTLATVVVNALVLFLSGAGLYTTVKHYNGG